MEKSIDFGDGNCVICNFLFIVAQLGKHSLGPHLFAPDSSKSCYIDQDTLNLLLDDHFPENYGNHEKNFSKTVGNDKDNEDEFFIAQKHFGGLDSNVNFS